MMLLMPPLSQAKDPEIWYDPIVHRDETTTASAGTDFWNMFDTPNTQWPKAQRHVKTLEISINSLIWWSNQRQGGIPNDAPTRRETFLDQPQYLPRMFKFVRDNHMALCICAEVVHGPKHLEGVDPHAAAVMEHICRQIQRDGGSVDYAGMDEPLCFGHYDKAGPQYSIDEFFDPAKGNVQASIAVIKKYFPNVKFVQAEPINAYNWVYTEEGAANYADEFAAWAAAFKQHTGSPITALHLDIWWPRPLKPVMRQFSEKVLRPQGILLGVMFNGDGHVKTDVEAIAAAKEHIRYWYAQGLPDPDQILMQDWFKHPTHNLPETDPTAFTSLVNWSTENVEEIKRVWEAIRRSPRP